MRIEFEDVGRDEAVGEVVTYPKVDKKDDRHWESRPRRSYETLAAGAFNGHKWAVVVYRSVAGWRCLDFDGVERPGNAPQASGCTHGYSRQVRDDHVSVSSATLVGEQEQWLVIGEVSKKVAVLKVECGDATHDVTLLDPKNVSLRSRFYAFVVDRSACSGRLAFDAAGELLEREHLYKNLDR